MSQPQRATGLFSAEELRALRPWAAAFESMPEDQVRLVGATLEAIAPLVEAAEEERRAGRAELDGFEDVIPRGAIERLLLSEFAWASIAPSEFLRRIAENEALRRRPVYQDPTDDRALVLLLDNGPSMLGRRRLIALGALFSLGLSARRRGAKLLWTASGFAREPLWMEGIDRRGLSRFIHQTAAQDWTEAQVRERLATGPGAEAAGALWLVGAAGAISERVGAGYRLEIDEIWPEPGRSVGPARPEALRARLVGASGVRREARVRTPPERLAAATLRAPFRAASAPEPADATGWTPSWLALESEGGAMLFRRGDRLIVRGPGRQTLAIQLPDGGEPLGVRTLGRQRSAVFWREGGALGLAFLDPRDQRPTIQRGLLADDHPLMSGRIEAHHAPPALRPGKSAIPAIAGPDGGAHQVARLDDWAVAGVEVSPVGALQDLRIVAWAQGWVLARRAAAPEEGLVLHRLRSGRRRRLAIGERPIAPPVRSCSPIGETGGVLIADAEGVLWIPSTSMGEGDPAPQPGPPREAFVLSVFPGGHASPFRPGAPMRHRRWSLEAWTPDQGLVTYAFDGDAWRSWSSRAPSLPGATLAIARSGKVFYAMVRDADDDENEGARTRILEFRRNDRQAKDSADSPWLRGARCVRL